MINRSLFSVMVLSAVASSAMATGFTVDISRPANDGKGDYNLNSIRFSDGTVYNSFKYAQDVRNLTYNQHSPNDYRVVAGPNTSISNKVTVLGDSHLSGKEVNLTTFLDRAEDVFQNRNLNHFFDVHTNCDPFGLTIDYRNNPLKDKILYTERGSGGSNSWVVIQAVDANGNKVGKNYLVNPHSMKDTGQDVAIYSRSDNPVFHGTQDLSILALDVKRDLGVNQVDFLRVFTPQKGVMYGNGLVYSGLGGGQDLAPDFKIIGTGEAVPEPATMALLALAALKRRKDKKSA